MGTGRERLALGPRPVNGGVSVWRAASWLLAHPVQNLRGLRPKSHGISGVFPPLLINGQTCGAALPWSSNLRASFTLTEAKRRDPGLLGARSQLGLSLASPSRDHACFVPHRTWPLFANKMLEWSEGTRVELTHCFGAVITHLNFCNILGYLQFLKSALGNSQN